MTDYRTSLGEQTINGVSHAKSTALAAHRIEN